MHPEDELAAQRLDLLAQAGQLRADLAGMMAASAGDNADDEHDPEGVTIAFERAQIVAMLGRTEARVLELDRALERLAEGTYGTCAVCGRPVGAERLAARPDATTCIDCATRSR
ncbi:MAG TPA: TraR/DksA C4-type zinc finger protein [Mycobacteriales bacterium]|nr:TraR/DksA C4-type zinc finger protein [Mycobacteriales bacterium]